MMICNKFLLSVFCFFLTFLISCENQEPQSIKVPAPEEIRLLVSCEGNFRAGNASLCAITDANEVYTDLFLKSNNRPLGDVAQSLTIIDGKIFQTLNNSAKIEVMSLDGFKQIATILYDKNISPQYVMPVNDHQAVVTDLENKYLLLIDTHLYKVIREIPINGSSSKQMVIANQKLYVSVNAQKIIIISLETLSQIGEIPIPVVGDSKLVQDKNSNIWALGQGYDDNYQKKTGLYCIDPSKDQVTKIIQFLPGYNVSEYGGRLDINKDKNRLYLNVIHEDKEGIYRLSVDDNSLPADPLFYYSQDVEMLYNMAVSPDETIFICDALSYKQRGWVFEFDLSGKKRNEYKVGIIPHYILFVE